jgi:hypothetical protein
MGKVQDFGAPRLYPGYGAVINDAIKSGGSKSYRDRPAARMERQRNAGRCCPAD